jgi:hypothetical protein
MAKRKSSESSKQGSEKDREDAIESTNRGRTPRTVDVRKEGDTQPSERSRMRLPNTIQEAAISPSPGGESDEAAQEHRENFRDRYHNPASSPPEEADPAQGEEA